MLDADNFEFSLARVFTEIVERQAELREQTLDEQRQAFLDEEAIRRYDRLQASYGGSLPKELTRDEWLAVQAYNEAEALWAERQRRIEQESSDD